jgi:hypothetical protein
VAQLNGSNYLTSSTWTTVWDHDLPDEVGFHTATYDVNGYLTGFTSDGVFGEGNMPRSYTATWTAGNLTRVQRSATIYSTAQYSTSLNRANFDLNWMVYEDQNFVGGFGSLFAIAGLYGKRNLNLVTQTIEHYDYGNGISSSRRAYSYQFDSDGYVTQWTASAPDFPDDTPVVYNIMYQ